MPYQSYGPFSDVHPSGTGRRPMGALSGVDLPPEDMYGGAKHNESRFIRCYQCGFPVDTERDLTNAEQPAISHPTTTVTDGSSVSHSITDTKVNAGCPFCGADRSAHGPQAPSPEGPSR